MNKRDCSYYWQNYTQRGLLLSKQCAFDFAEDAVYEAVIADAIEEAAKEKVVGVSEAAGEDTDEETANEKETGEETTGEAVTEEAVTEEEAA